MGAPKWAKDNIEEIHYRREGDKGRAAEVSRTRPHSTCTPQSCTPEPSPAFPPTCAQAHWRETAGRAGLDTILSDWRRSSRTQSRLGRGGAWEAACCHVTATAPHSLAGWRRGGLERLVGGSAWLPVTRAELPGRAAQAEGGVSDSWRDPEGGRAPRGGACPECQVRCGTGTEEVRDGDTGWPGSGVPVKPTLYDTR